MRVWLSGPQIGQASYCNNKMENGLQSLVLCSVFLLVTWLQLYSATVESHACETDSAVTPVRVQCKIGKLLLCQPSTRVSFVDIFEKCPESVARI